MAERYIRSKSTGKVMSESELHGFAKSLQHLSPSEVYDAYVGSGKYEAVPEPKTLGGFVSNAVSSTGQLIGDTVNGLIDATVTLPMAAAERAWDWANGRPVADPPKMSDVAGAVGNAVKGRAKAYGLDKAADGDIGGAVKQAWDTFYADPAGVASDAAVVLGGASAVTKAAGAGRVARGLKTAADLVDPLTAATKVPQAALNAKARVTGRPSINQRVGRRWYKSIASPRLQGKSMEELDNMADVGVSNEIDISRAGAARASDMRRAVDDARNVEVAAADAAGVTVDPSASGFQNATEYRKSISQAIGVEGDEARKIADRTLGRTAQQLGGRYDPAAIQVTTPPIPIGQANDIRKATNKVLTDSAFDEGRKGVRKEITKAALRDITKEIDNAIPGFREKGILERDLINLIEAIESHVKKSDNRGSSSSFYTQAQMGKAVATGNVTPNALAGIARTVNDLFPGFTSKLAIAIGRDHTVASKLRSRLNALATIERARREGKKQTEAAASEPPVLREPPTDDPYGDGQAVPAAQQAPVDMDDPFKE